ncbi:hypothetical protein J4465_03115 [Candidatus Pacearchaeota archaeon]|nr:hypothetical protein [Candidatus Pacearchaeota archaeon]
MIKNSIEHKALKKIRRPHILFDFKYPKFFILILTIVLAFIIFKERNIPFIDSLVLHSGYFGTFVSGIFLSWGFTAAPATAFLLILAKSQNILFASLIGGLGALIGDLVIFHFIRFSFKKEIACFEREKVIKWIRKKIPEKIKHYLLVIFADIMLASPLPDEIGVTILATYNKLSVKVFSIMTYVLHAIGILIIFLIGRAI